MVLAGRQSEHPPVLLVDATISTLMALAWIEVRASADTVPGT
jgi:hypothetical protein